MKDLKLEKNRATENPWKKLKSKSIYENPWIKLREDEVINPNGGQNIYGVVEFKNLAIGIVPLDEEYNTWLVGQYRYALDEYSWEIPMGGGALEVDALDSAKRELKEETGLESKSWTCISRIHTSNSVCNELGYIFLARELHLSEPDPEETEQLEIRKLPINEAFKMVLENKITDSLSVAGILKIKHLIDHNLLGSLPKDFLVKWD
jgi:8-oxo-dGTP pyrophosphatase MutT (NUDIX family)